MEIYGRVRQATDDSTTRRMRFACCVTKITETYSEYVVLNFHATMDTRTPLNITLHSQWLSC